MTDIELANKLSEILFYNTLSDKAKAVIDEAYAKLKEPCADCQEFDCSGCKYKEQKDAN